MNSRVIKDDLEPCMFGHALLRIVHHIVNLRRKYPNKIIWIRKDDFKSAYRRFHLRASTAIKSAVVIKMNTVKYLLISLRMLFGGSPCPSDFSLAADIITDTINDLMICREWDPKIVHSQYIRQVPEKIALGNEVQFASARAMSVSIPDEEDLKADVFIDDIISVAPDIGDNLQRVVAAPCTVLHAVSHQAEKGDMFVPRDDIIAADKNIAEGAPEETKICLGWLLDTRRLLISLPEHKYKAWDMQIKGLISQRSVSCKNLESVLGRLENVAIILRMFAHFLNNIRALQIKAAKTGHNVSITGSAKEDMKLARLFLKRAYKGVSLNTMVFRKPDHTYVGDASEHGLGGFALNHGGAWRYEMPAPLQGRAHINLLEFLVQLINIWIDIINNKSDHMTIYWLLGIVLQY